MVFVEQAIEAINQRDLEQANLHAIPIAQLGQYWAASKGAKEIEADSFNPFGAHLYNAEAKDKIDPEAAKTFLELSAAQLIPAWVIAQLDVKLMRAAAK